MLQLIVEGSWTAFHAEHKKTQVKENLSKSVHLVVGEEEESDPNPPEIHKNP